MGFSFSGSDIASIGSSVVGGLFGMAGAAKTAKAIREANEKNLAYQKEFAQNGIRWKVADAQAAGLHPLIGAGAQGQSFSPSFVGDTTAGDSLAQMGQNISRAVDATLTRKEREEQLQLAKAEKIHELMRQERHDQQQDALMRSEIDKNRAQANLYNSQALGQAGMVSRSSFLGQPRNPPMVDTIDLKNSSGRSYKGISPEASQAYENVEILGSNIPAVINWLSNGGIEDSLYNIYDGLSRLGSRVDRRLGAIWSEGYRR